MLRKGNRVDFFGGLRMDRDRRGDLKMVEMKWKKRMQAEIARNWQCLGCVVKI